MNLAVRPSYTGRTLPVAMLERPLSPAGPDEIALPDEAAFPDVVAPGEPTDLAAEEARLAALAGDESEARVDALLDLVEASHTRDLDRQFALLDEARRLAERLGYEAGRMRAVGLEGRAHFFRSDFDPAVARLMEAAVFFDAAGDEQRTYEFRGFLALIYLTQGQYEEALEIALDNLQYARAQGDVASEAWVLHGLSSAYLDLGDLDRAFDYAQQALACFTRLGQPFGQARAHGSVGAALQRLGRLGEAAAHHEVSLALFREVGDPLGEARARYDLGLVAHAQGGYERALEHHREALALRRAVGNPQSESSSLRALGETLLAMGRADEAVAVLQEALTLAEALDLAPRVFQMHRALADAYEAQGDYARALHHHRLFHSVCETTIGAQATGRIHTLQIRHDVERAQQEAEIERLRNVELKEKNEQLERLLDELRRTQDRLVQSEKMAGLGRVTAGIAHELKNPLNFVVNFATLNAEIGGALRGTLVTHRDALPAAFAEAFDDELATLSDNAARVLAHARRADGILRSMLGHVRATEGERRPVHLHRLLDQSIQSVFGEGGDGLAAIVERHYDAEVGEVEAAPGSLGRVFFNLLENARYAVCRHAEEAGKGYRPRIEVRTRALPGLVQVRVVDNGPGVPEAHCTRLFEPFFTTKPPGEGTGLGLSLAYDIVTQGHGGSLAVHSRESEGATFVVTLPVEGEG